jgi:hypothetical protein
MWASLRSTGFLDQRTKGACNYHAPSPAEPRKAAAYRLNYLGINTVSTT